MITLEKTAMSRSRFVLSVVVGLSVIFMLVAFSLAQIHVTLRVRISATQLGDRLIARNVQVKSVALYDNYMIVSLTPRLDLGTVTVTQVPLMRDGEIAFDWIKLDAADGLTLTLIEQQAKSVTSRIQKNF